MTAGGFNLYAGRAIDGRDRKQLERQLRYVGRPPSARRSESKLRTHRCVSGAGSGLSQAFADGFGTMFAANRPPRAARTGRVGLVPPPAEAISWVRSA